MPPSVLALSALVLGLALGYYLRYQHALNQKRSIEVTIKERVVEAEEKALKIIEKAEAKAETVEREKKQEFKDIEEKLAKTEDRLIRKEEFLDKRQIDVDTQIDEVRGKIEQIKEIKGRLDEREQSIEEKIAAIAGISKEDAYAHILERAEKQHEADLAARIQKLRIRGDEQFDDEARNIITSAIHRIGNTLRVDIMSSTIEIPSDEMKGKIIGREGRNVRAFERATGVDVLIDDTPGHITLSSFDPVRREIARVALEHLLADGRIQPAKIEEVVEKARAEVGTIVRKMGEKAAYEAGVPGLHPDLVKILGRLHFRTSYGQNVLWHSVEMAHIAAIIAEEVGADVAVSRAGALLHDIGKTVSQEVQGTHVEIGIRILEKYGVDQKVIIAMRAHHEEYPYETPESIIVQVADAISGGRPGARRDSIENYIKRLGELEEIATSMPGVEKAFAIQAGREIRVIVNPEKVTDLEAMNLARSIATDIEERLRYPGEIKVNVIRESRAIEYAR